MPARVEGLRLSDIRYLALEGGGGKGFAYLGALQLLEKNKALTGLRDDINVLRQIKRVAGTSAGAITALMIALGMSSEDILNEIKTPSLGTRLGADHLESFDDFFDPSSPRLMPSLGGKYEERTDSSIERQLISLLKNAKPGALYDKFFEFTTGRSPNLVQDFYTGMLTSLGPMFGVVLFVNYLVTGSFDLKKSFDDAPAAVKLLLNEFRFYVPRVQRDMGFFCGFKARNYFDDLIQTRCGIALDEDPRNYANLTFQDFHEKIVQRQPANAPIKFTDLIVCGSNVSTGLTQLFCYEHTPKLPIADAVRISMGMPIVFKPYMISKEQKGGPPCGTYVDGGYWNNLLLREADPSRSINKTLGIRLQIDIPRMICTFWDLAVTMAQNGVFGGGESQAREDFAKNIILLDTDGLSLFDFNPPDDVKQRVNHRSRRTVCEYFGWPVDPTDRDDKDEVASSQRLSSQWRAKAACGKCES
jgi:predicted acylesterase/phospholipase RssA